MFMRTSCLIHKNKLKSLQKKTPSKEGALQTQTQ